MHLLYSDVKIAVNQVPVIESNENRCFYIPLNSYYTIDINNKSNKTIEYNIIIDNKFIGIWRVAPFKRISLERPAQQANKFYFIDKVNTPNLQFTPGPSRLIIGEWVCKQDPICSEEMHPLETDSLGGTVMGEASFQQFKNCKPRKKILVAEFYIRMKAAAVASASNVFFAL